MIKSQPRNGEKSQADKFREAARDLETDDDEKRFDERLKRIAKTPASKTEKKQDE